MNIQLRINNSRFQFCLSMKPFQKAKINPMDSIILQASGVVVVGGERWVADSSPSCG